MLWVQRKASSSRMKEINLVHSGNILFDNKNCGIAGNQNLVFQEKMCKLQCVSPKNYFNNKTNNFVNVLKNR